MDLNYNNKQICCNVTCWKKPDWDENGNPIGVEPQEKEKKKKPEIELEKYKDKSVEDEQSYCALLKNTLEKLLVQVNQQTITIGDRKEPITYYQDLQTL